MSKYQFSFTIDPALLELNQNSNAAIEFDLVSRDQHEVFGTFSLVPVDIPKQEVIEEVNESIAEVDVNKYFPQVRPMLANNTS